MTNNAPQIRLIDGKPITTSRQLAEYFHKQHNNILQKIHLLECSEQFLTANFSAVKFNHRGNEYTEYQITRDGFAFLAMGFTGKKAAKFKEDYIEAFNKMESKLIEHSNLCTGIPKLSVTDKKTLERVIQFYLSVLGQMTSSLERGALVAYLKHTQMNYTIEKAMEYRTGLNPNKIVGLLTDNSSVLSYSDFNLRVTRVGEPVYKWFNRYLENRGQYNGIEYIPE